MKEKINEERLITEDIDEPYQPYKYLMFSIPIFINADLIVETGVRFGRSTKLFLGALDNTGGELVSIDIEDYPDTREEIDNENWEFIVDNSLEVGRKWNRGEIDLLYLDSNHHSNFVEKEIDIWFPHVRDGGIILMHDITPKNLSIEDGPLPPIVKYVEEHNLEHYYFLEREGMALIFNRT